MGPGDESGIIFVKLRARCLAETVTGLAPQRIIQAQDTDLGDPRARVVMPIWIWPRVDGGETGGMRLGPWGLHIWGEGREREADAKGRDTALRLEEKSNKIRTENFLRDSATRRSLGTLVTALPGEWGDSRQTQLLKKELRRGTRPGACLGGKEWD